MGKRKKIEFNIEDFMIDKVLHKVKERKNNDLISHSESLNKKPKTKGEK